MGKNRQFKFLVCWWMSQTPYAAIFDNRTVAEASANVRNALMIVLSGTDVKVDEVLDWYRRSHSKCNHKDEKEAASCGDGVPMPAEWRELNGPIRFPGIRLAP